MRLFCMRFLSMCASDSAVISGNNIRIWVQFYAKKSYRKRCESHLIRLDSKRNEKMGQIKRWVGDEWDAGGRGGSRWLSDWPGMGLSSRINSTSSKDPLQFNLGVNLPVAWMLFRRAATENGDMNSLSNDKDRAMSAIALAVICNLTEFRSPSHCKARIQMIFPSTTSTHRHSPLSTCQAAAPLGHCQRRHRSQREWHRHLWLESWACLRIRDCHSAHWHHDPVEAATIEMAYWNSAVAPPIDELFGLRARQWSHCHRCLPCRPCCFHDSISAHRRYCCLWKINHNDELGICKSDDRHECWMSRGVVHFGPWSESNVNRNSFAGLASGDLHSFYSSTSFCFWHLNCSRKPGTESKNLYS